jgi:hypothetical protein
MEADLLASLGTSAGGGLLGALLAYLGIKSRLDSIERVLADMVTSRECVARSGGLSRRLDNSIDRFSRIDANIEVIRQMLMNSAHTSKGE